MRPRHAVLFTIPEADPRLTPATPLESTPIGMLQVLILNSLNLFRMNTFSGLPRSAQFWCSASPLDATLMDLPASVANKTLTAGLRPLDATLTKNWGMGLFFPFWTSPHVTNVRPSQLALASASYSPLLLPLFPDILVYLLPCFVFDRHRDENHVTATPLDSALTNCDARNSFRMRFYENCRVSLTPSPLFSLFAQRVFHNSFALKSFRTLSKNSRVWPNSGHSGTHTSPLRPPRHRLGIEPWGEPLSWHSFFGHSFRFRDSVLASRTKWLGRRDLNSGPPAPKPAGLSLGSPSFSISFLKTNELEQYLVVAPCTEMWLRMHGVPQISHQRRNSETRSPMPDSCITPTLRLKAERGQGYSAQTKIVGCGVATAISRR